MAAGGVAGTMQVAIMGRFGERIGVLEALAFATLVTAAIALVALLLVRQTAAGYEAALRSPPWLWLGAACGAFIVFAITVSAPRIGTTASVAVFIAFQLAAGAVFDRFGLFGLERIPLGWPRLLGLALLAVGAALSLKR
jgi:transporter family-2 protein